ncbi:putative E3 ubiquitin-protein ligase HUL4 [Sugiyamaella lignohabitans]|uniref:HECT-type E3 ubiquitin transferase n=1 Tax=Sugiyamaella lignohabitans TaxID=796027 RepID=A0A167DCT0_9ASCO|nr:putative E3 ubiquitin-protein ligase HUL4 [Sugiyamaella lignohabitans]ANB12770.1 putative E3 ubiquitin-protein ligase HUL4 [Sugiyamaella lignohabitans]
MPPWSLFTSPTKKKSGHSNGSTGKTAQHRQDQESALIDMFGSSIAPSGFAGPNISTMSSTEEIMRSVSEVAAATTVANGSVNGTSNSSGTNAVGAVAGSTDEDSHLSKLVVKKCHCCGTKLQVPEKLTYYKCAICETFYDVKPGVITRTENAVGGEADVTVKGSASEITGAAAATKSYTLSIEEIEKVIDQIRRHKESNPGDINTLNDDYADLDSILTSSLSTVDSMNESFSLHQKRASYSRPNINFTKVEMFYTLIMNCPGYERPMDTILTCQLNLLKRLRKVLESPFDICFLLVILENPILYIPALFSKASAADTTNSILQAPKPRPTGPPDPLLRIRVMAVDVLERTVGTIAHGKKACRHYLLNWLSRYSLSRFQSKVDLLNAYVAHRLLKHYRTVQSRARIHPIPKTTTASSSSSSSHRKPHSSSSSAAASTPPYSSSPSPARNRKRKGSSSSQIKPDLYSSDWKISSFVRVLSILFNANSVSTNKIPVSNFYNTMVDYADVTSDFDEWQKTRPFTTSNANSNSGVIHGNALIPQLPFAPGRPQFSFCQYPFLLSMGSKTEILEHDARRQMELKAQEAFFGSLANKVPESPFLHIRVNRNSLLQDSFEAIDKNDEHLKKGLKVEFIGEPGIDAGGLKKEWFLLLFKELFDPSNALFIEDEESHYCWFDASSEHALKYYKLTGVAIGLALYNSTILDVNLPSVLFKKLLSSPYSIQDFTKLYPSYGANLQKLLNYEGDDIEEVFSLDFSICSQDPADRSKIKETVLIPNGKTILVNKSNRQDYVKRVMAHYLDISVKRQFEAFKQGFYKVAGGNALSLFRPEEIELLIRGSLEAIDVDALRSVTRYQHWGPKGYDAEQDIVVKWFWKFFKNLDPLNQRKLLIFVTGSDRIPATGIVNMPFRISKIGEDSDRFPISHTCFNQLCLYKYSSREKLTAKIMTAINESEGFGIK